jgi:hypothetical protein
MLWICGDRLNEEKEEIAVTGVKFSINRYRKSSKICVKAPVLRRDPNFSIRIPDPG